MLDYYTVGVSKRSVVSSLRSQWFREALSGDRDDEPVTADFFEPHYGREPSPRMQFFLSVPDLYVDDYSQKRKSLARISAVLRYKIESELKKDFVSSSGANKEFGQYALRIARNSNELDVVVYDGRRYYSKESINAFRDDIKKRQRESQIVSCRGAFLKYSKQDLYAIEPCEPCEPRKLVGGKSSNFQVDMDLVKDVSEWMRREFSSDVDSFHIPDREYVHVYRLLLLEHGAKADGRAVTFKGIPVYASNWRIRMVVHKSSL